ncbi:hypothetical protein ABBQ32_004935 [Trebouxia sp. C0010 RCD-2024]
MSAARSRSPGSGSIHQSPVHRLSREATSARSPLSPFTYRWPQDEVKEVVEKAQFVEQVRCSGWLLKQHGNGPHPSWSRRWVHISLPLKCVNALAFAFLNSDWLQFYLLDDRLCYTDEPGKVEDVRYIPLDRIPVRALPRGYGPQIGVTVIEDRQIDRTELPPQSSKKRACVFSVQCGTHTHFMAAGTAAEAETWVERITQTWVHCSKFTGRSIRARNLADSFVHTQQHLLQENTALRQSIDDLTKQQTSRQPDTFSRHTSECKLDNHAALDLSQGSGTVATTEVTELVRDPLTTKLSQNAGVNSPHQLSQQASGMDLPGPMPCDSPSAGALHTQHKEEEWLHPSVELVTYELELDTGSCKAAGTSAHVLLELFGGEGVTPGAGSGVHCLEQGPYQPTPFGPGQTDVFEIRCEQLDEPVMVRVTHDNSGPSPAWFLEEVRVRQKGTEDWFHFYCGRWLATGEDDGAISRDIYRGERPAGVRYHLAFKTSDIRGAGTSANVFLVMHGQQASGAKHQLSAAPHDFDRGCSDQFTVEDTELGDLSHVTLGHDSAGQSPSWHLEALVITHEPSGQQWNFGGNMWFGPHQGDGLTQRDLYPVSGQQHLDWYTLLLCTSDKPGAGTDADVFATIHGAEASSPRVLLPSRPEDFLRGNKDTFRMQLKALGEITQLTVGHNNRGRNPSWHLDHAEVTHEASGVTYYFACVRWFSRDEEDGLIERDLCPGHHKGDNNPDMHYTAELFTSDVRGAGTDADVSLELFGHLGSSGPQNLHGKEAFARAAVDVFQFACQGVGEMQMLRISHNNAGRNPDWHLQKVILTDKETGTSAVFLCNNWLSCDRDDGLISRDLLPSTDAPSEEDLMEAVTADYTVWIHASDSPKADTDGRVAIELHGQGGSSSQQWLHNQQKTPFSRGKVSQFELHLSHVGPLERLTLATDAAAWLCDLVVVHDAHLHETVYFPCGRWLGKRDAREVVLEGSRTDPRPPLHKYRVTVITSDIRNAGTDAEVSIDIKGKAPLLYIICSSLEQPPAKAQAGCISA